MDEKCLFIFLYQYCEQKILCVCKNTLCVNWALAKKKSFVGVNFINVKCTNFSYKRCFGSFYYVHVTRKNPAETMFVRKICAFNVDEIDGRITFRRR